MTAVSVFLCCLCVVAFTEVAAWTIDLKEVRKFYEEQSKHQELVENWSKNEFPSDEYGGLFEGRTGNYADGYAYGGYMEKKVHGIVRNGTKYLDGLKLAIENFKSTVENCSRVNFTRYPGLLWNGTALDFFNSSWVQGLGSNPSWPDILNISAAMLRLNTTNTTQGFGPEVSDMMRCANATRDREKVRKLADLAMWTTRQIQDRVMAGSYKGPEEEDIELLLRLAYFLEQLAHVTGFDPDAAQFVNEVPSNLEQTSTTPPNPLILPVPEEVKLKMIRCLQENSSIPATERCAIPVDLPPLLRLVLNIPENNEPTPINTLNDLILGVDSESLDENIKIQPLETLQTSENDQTSKLTSLRAVKSVRKRSADNTALNVMKYYVKHKVWDGSNNNPDENATENNLSVNNDISARKILQKRSINDYNITKDRYDLKKIRKSIQKRSIKYEKGFIVRQSEDPMQDISYYVKNKPGTNIRPSLVGVAEARLGLERIFQTGNIEVVRRYGANYNPLIPSPFYFGVAKTMADI